MVVGADRECHRGVGLGAAADDRSLLVAANQVVSGDRIQGRCRGRLGVNIYKGCNRRGTGVASLIGQGGTQAVAALGQYVGGQVLVSCCDITGGEGGSSADLKAAILQNQSITHHRGSAVSGAGVEADAHARRAVVGVGGNAQTWRLSRDGVERLALRRGNGGQAGSIANSCGSIGNGALRCC